MSDTKKTAQIACTDKMTAIPQFFRNAPAPG
jgi:hypothetical protein